MYIPTYIDRQIDGWIDKQIDRQIVNRQIDRQIDRDRQTDTDRQVERWRDSYIVQKTRNHNCESMKEIVIKYMLSLKDETSVSYQTVKKAMSNLIRDQYYESKFL